MKTLSILTPSFNYAWCMEDALQSVAQARQTVPEGWAVEHVVVDDGSTDESVDILERWGAQITFERRAKNRGQSSTLNRCLELSTGEWIGWLNADDFHLSLSLRDACQALDDSIDVVHGDVALVDRQARFHRLMPEHPFSLWVLRWWGTYLPVGAVFLRRSLLVELKWREDLQLLLDWDLWLRAAESGARFMYVPRPLAAVRVHPGQESRQHRPGRLEEQARVRRRHGLPSKRLQRRWLPRIGALSHAGYKLLSGGYARQRRTAVLRGRSMRWFQDPEARSAVDSLYHLASDRKRRGG